MPRSEHVNDGFVTVM